MLTQSLSERVVINLCTDILNTNRTLYTDNFYTSVSLAKRLLLQNTHLVGTLRSNHKLNPPRLQTVRLEKGEMMTFIHDGVAVSKWVDKREVTFLTTKHKPLFVEVENRRKTETHMKPKAIVAYNAAKTYINVSDQRKTYADPCRSGVKWYRKTIVKLFCNTAVVNAHVLFTGKTKKKMKITEFGERIVNSLFAFRSVQQPSTPLLSPARVKHQFSVKPARGRCVLCFCQKWEIQWRPLHFFFQFK